MKKYVFLLSALVLFAFSSCHKFAGNPISKDFAVGAYTGLEVEDAFDVTVSDTVDFITITAGERFMPKVVVEVVENTLKIYLKGINHSIYGTDLKVVIPYNADLTKVNLSGASEFHSKYGLEGHEVDVELSGASDFYCNIDADEVDIDLSGASNFYGDIRADETEMDLSASSDIKGYVEVLDLDLELSGASTAVLEGQVSKLRIALSGASDIKKTINGNRYGLVCNHCEGSISGASDAYIHCDGTIKVNLSGASDLHYTGDANTMGSDAAGASDIYHDVLP